MSGSLRVLIVEDSEDDAQLLIVNLENSGYIPIYQRVDTKEDMERALEQSSPWDIVLADYSMPRFNAIEALNLLKNKNLDLPFIIISGAIGEDTAVAAMQAGAHDYIVKGKLARLIPAVERELREAKIREEHRKAREKLKYLAYYDDITGLPNRTLFLETLDRIILSRQDNDRAFAVLFLHLERFSIIKYSLGHSASNRLLVAAARRIEKCLSDEDMVARVSGDEFAILLTQLEEAEDATIVAETIYRKLAHPFKLDGPVIISGTNIGIVLSTIGYKQAENYLQAADTAMHRAQINLLEGSVLFETQMHERAIARLKLESDLQQAIKHQQLHLNYQPIVSLHTGEISGFEALVRWKHPQQGYISPDRFIPLSEETGLIVPLGQWVLSEACQTMVSWQKQFTSPLTISVNLSGIQLFNPDFLVEIDFLLESLPLKGENLKLEITENVLMENSQSVTTILEKLKERNIKLCIDDFGVGYSSLSYLHYLPIDTLKLDRFFICKKLDRKNLDIIEAIISLAHSLGLDVVAEGLENKLQLEVLQNLECEYGQGYFFSPPLESQEILAFMERGIEYTTTINN